VPKRTVRVAGSSISYHFDVGESPSKLLGYTEYGKPMPEFSLYLDLPSQPLSNCINRGVLGQRGYIGAP
jgi:hypothetical protein